MKRNMESGLHLNNKSNQIICLFVCFLKSYKYTWIDLF